MSMIYADQSSHDSHYRNSHYNGLRGIVSSLAVAALILVAVPVFALTLSYLAGGLVASTLLFAYVSAGVTNVPFLVAALAIMSAVVSMSRLLTKAA